MGIGLRRELAPDIKQSPVRIEVEALLQRQIARWRPDEPRGAWRVRRQAFDVRGTRHGPEDDDTRESSE